MEYINVESKKNKDEIRDGFSFKWSFIDEINFISISKRLILSIIDIAQKYFVFKDLLFVLKIISISRSLNSSFIAVFVEHFNFNFESVISLLFSFIFGGIDKMLSSYGLSFKAAISKVILIALLLLSEYKLVLFIFL